MQIGFVKQESKVFKENGESKEVKWLECHFRIAGLRPFNAKMSPNKNKTEDKHPDFVIYLRGNVNKGDAFRDVAIGSLWVGEKVIDGVLKKFMTGKIEVAFKETAIAVWRAEPKFQGEVISYLYDIKTMKDNRGQSNGDGYDNYELDHNSYEPQQQPYTPPPTYDKQETQVPQQQSGYNPSTHASYQPEHMQHRTAQNATPNPNTLPNIDEEIPF